MIKLANGCIDPREYPEILRGSVCYAEIRKSLKYDYYTVSIVACPDYYYHTIPNSFMTTFPTLYEATICMQSFGIKYWNDRTKCHISSHCDCCKERYTLKSPPMKCAKVLCEHVICKTCWYWPQNRTISCSECDEKYHISKLEPQLEHWMGYKIMDPESQLVDPESQLVGDDDAKQIEQERVVPVKQERVDDNNQYNGCDSQSFFEKQPYNTGNQMNRIENERELDWNSLAKKRDDKSFQSRESRESRELSESDRKLDWNSLAKNTDTTNSKKSSYIPPYKRNIGDRKWQKFKKKEFIDTNEHDNRNDINTNRIHIPDDDMHIHIPDGDNDTKHEIKDVSGEKIKIV